jgi:drug/metabolite transporter (DMT)-like permease
LSGYGNLAYYWASWYYWYIVALVFFVLSILTYKLSVAQWLWVRHQYLSILSILPLVDDISVTFVTPFMVTLNAKLVLREAVGIRRWTAVTMGFIGVLIVPKLGLGVFHPATLLILIADFYLRFAKSYRGSSRGLTGS